VLTRLAHVETLLGRFGSADLCRQLESTRDTIRAFARGVYPRRLEEMGLAVLREMTLPLDHAEVNMPDERFAPDVEAAAYFLCFEALTNVAKYARATATWCRSKSSTRSLRSRLRITASKALIRRKVLGYSDFKIVWMCSAGCLQWRVPRAAPACAALSPWNARRSSQRHLTRPRSPEETAQGLRQ
jgi:hypothetical protein